MIVQFFVTTSVERSLVNYNWLSEIPEHCIIIANRLVNMLEFK